MNLYSPETITQLSKAQTFKELGEIALKILVFSYKKNGEQKFSQVCGPISTGGEGTISKNLLKLEKTIQKLLSQNILIFNQMPLENDIARIFKIQHKDKTGYPWKLLTDIYQPLFESKMINTFYFLPDWQSSTGARWEHDEAERLGIKIIYLEQL